MTRFVPAAVALSNKFRNISIILNSYSSLIDIYIMSLLKRKYLEAANTFELAYENAG